MAGPIDGSEVARLAKLAQAASSSASTAADLVRHDERSLGVVTDVLLNRAGRAETKFTKAAATSSELATSLTDDGAPHLADLAGNIATSASAAAGDATSIGWATAAGGDERLGQLVRNGRVAGRAAGLADGLAAVRSHGGTTTAFADGAALDAAVLGARLADGSMPGASAAHSDAAHAAGLARSATHAQASRGRRLLAEGVRDYATAWARVDGDATLPGRATPESIAALVNGTFSDHRAMPIVARRVRAAAAELHTAIPAAGPRASADPLLVLQDHAWSATRAMNDQLLDHGASNRRVVTSRAQAVTYDAMAPLAADATAAKAVMTKDAAAWDSASYLTLSSPSFPERSTGQTVFDVAGQNQIVAETVQKLGTQRPHTAPLTELSATQQQAVLDRAKAHVERARTLWAEAGEAEYPTGSTDITGTKGRLGRTYRSWKFVARTGFTTAVHKVGEAGSEIIAARRLLATVADEDAVGTGALFEQAMSMSVDHVGTARNATLNLDVMANSWTTKHALENLFPKHADYGQMQATLNGLDGVIDALHLGVADDAAVESAAAAAGAGEVVAPVAEAAADAAAPVAATADEDVLGF